MKFTRTLSLAGLLVIGTLVPVVASAQMQDAPKSQVVITTQLATGVTAPAGNVTVTVVATNPSLTTTTNPMASTLSFGAAFTGDVRTVTFIPGSYTVSAAGAQNQYFTYSQDCTGFTPLSGATRSCVITLSNTPPPPQYPCPNYSPVYGCGVIPPTPYSGPMGPTQLTCTPGYQSVAAGQSATFTANAGAPGVYTWTTPDRTFLNIGPTFTTVFQNVGTQTVMVNQGVQNAACTVNVVAGAGPISYIGQNPISTFIPAALPNTGFAPLDAAALAFAVVFLIGAAIFVAPWVRHAIVSITR